MAKAIRTGKVYKFNTSRVGPRKATISCEQGECSLDSEVEIMGIQIHFQGKAEITPELPEGWILQGNNNKMLIFSLSGVAIKKQILFTYKGKINISNLILSDKNANKVTCGRQISRDDWESQSDSLSSDTTNWDQMEIKKTKYKIRKTIYNLPDYNLPEVDKKQIKRQKRKSQTTYRSTKGSGSIGGY